MTDRPPNLRDLEVKDCYSCIHQDLAEYYYDEYRIICKKYNYRYTTDKMVCDSYEQEQ